MTEELFWLTLEFRICGEFLACLNVGKGDTGAMVSFQANMRWILLLSP